MAQEDAGRHMEHDWHPGLVPPNVVLAADAFLKTAYSLTMFHSRREPGLTLGRASGAYNETAFVVGPKGRIDVGAFACLNSTTLICHDHIDIGAHCLIAWGVVIMDTWIALSDPPARRRAALLTASADPARHLPPPADPRPVRLEDNVWVGFDAVVMPGVTLGQGCVIGCKTVVTQDVPPYAVVMGSPPRVVRHLDPDDTQEARAAAMQTLVRPRKVSQITQPT